MHISCLEEASKQTVWRIGVGVAVVVVFVAFVAFCCYRKYKRRQQPSVVQHAYGATTNTATINNTALQPGVKAHPGNYPLQPSYLQQPYPPPQQAYMPQQQIYTSTGVYPQQPQAQAGMTLEVVSLDLCLSLKSLKNHIKGKTG